MPELPEVHTTATILNKLIRNLVIRDAWTDYNSTYHKGKDNIKNPEFFKVFKNKIVGAKIARVYRKAKNVLIELDNSETIVVHMKMTGQLLFGNYKKDAFTRFVHFSLTFSTGEKLDFSDMRKFGTITICPTNLLDTKHFDKLGPEPLLPSFTYKIFKERLLMRSKGIIKKVLLEPSVIVGIGNIYSDEMLFISNIHPLSIVAKIPEKNLKLLFKAMKKVLTLGIDLGGDSMSDYRNPYGEKGAFQNNHQAYRMHGKKCSKKGCKGVISRVKFGERHAHFCNLHQVCYNTM